MKYTTISPGDTNYKKNYTQLSVESDRLYPKAFDAHDGRKYIRFNDVSTDIINGLDFLAYVKDLFLVPNPINMWTKKEIQEAKEMREGKKHTGWNITIFVKSVKYADIIISKYTGSTESKLESKVLTLFSRYVFKPNTAVA